MVQTAAILTQKNIAFAAVVLFTIWLYSSTDDSRPQKFIWEVYHNGWNPLLKEDVFKSPPVDSEAIRDICSSTKWNQSLIFTCDDNNGGIGKVRNSILNCVRYTIAAGGSLVMPKILEREMPDRMGESEPLARRHGPKRHELDYLFDVNHFYDSLGKSCPELILIRKMDEKAGDNQRFSLLPETLFPDVPTSGLQHPEEWPQRLGDWIETKLAPGSVSEEKPIIIDLEHSFLHYPTHSDGHAVAHVFGNILQFRSDVREIATNALGTLVEWYDFSVNISRHGMLKPSFLGVHIDTENPLLERRHEIDIEYSHYDALTRAYFDLSSNLQLPIVYAASGNLEEIEHFNLDATDLNIAVTFKEDLLEENDLKKLHRLTYDQRSLVDYLVLTKAESFAGIGHSPFSWNVALVREQYGAVMEGVLDGDIWRDGMNTLFGVRPDYVESSACMWS
ncbi:putative alternative oxidase [Golovinomyces cichoracearum]|uniref:Putative alternative oxidase n=1 Tax=Golovinomyces cichoracearum TaxID=62708 RepID=A0A420J7H9_9PEZI|nr:putative alternative oxidase [Golovinomyces cichoracearum]